MHLPRGPERELVRDRDREYTLRGSESRTLATVGAFRVVSSRDLRDHNGGPADPRSGDLRHLREQGLDRDAARAWVPRPGGEPDEGLAAASSRATGTATKSTTRPSTRAWRASGNWNTTSRSIAPSNRPRTRLPERGAHIERVVLDHELKGEYQRWLHERDKDRDDYDGHPDRTPDEIREWAHEHDLPYFDEEVHFPDVRIEYQEPDGRWEREDIEVVTPHYRGAHGASVARSGFSSYRGISLRISGRSGGGKGAGRHGGLAEELWR